MKVLHVIPSLAAKEGGPSVAIHAIARAAAREGVHVTVVSTASREEEGGAPLREPFLDSGVTYLQFRRDIAPYKVSWSATRWLKTHVCDFDIVHVHALFSYMSTAASRIAAWQHKPFIIRPLGVLNRWGLQNRRRTAKQLSLRLVELPLLRHAAAVHFTSTAELEEAKLVAAVVADKAAIIPVPLTPHSPAEAERLLEKWPHLRGRRVVLFISRITQKKRLELLIEALRFVRESASDTMLLVAGDGEEAYLDALCRYARELNIESAVVWMGHIDGEEKAAAFALADVFVLPSASENFGIAAAEALSHRVPVVLCDGVAVSSDVRDYDAGWVVDGNAHHVARAITEVFNSPAEAARRVRNGSRLVEERYSPAAVGAQLKTLYQSVVKSRRRRS